MLPRLSDKLPVLRHDAFVRRIDYVCAHPRLPEAGRRVLEESVYSFSGFKPVKVDLLADWKSNPLQQRSWQWGTAALNFLPWLIAHHSRARTSGAIGFAMDAIRSWQAVADSGELKGYEFLDHDHATALRGENAMLLLAYLHRQGLEQRYWAELARFIDGIADLLEKDSFYSRHTNHGLEQSRILAMCADLFPAHRASPRRWKIASSRLMDELRFAFTSDGVHVENSPAYHQYVCDSFLKIADMFPRERLPELNGAIDEVMPKAMRFLVHIVRPDSKFPIIGDTGAKWAVNPFSRYASTREYEWLEYVASKRLRGKAPDELIAAFPEAGYVVLRDRWKSPGVRGREYHVVMKCGFHSLYHRHDDDFNIVMMCGEDWLIDGGSHSYAEQLPVRRYLRSKWAHNVPVIDRGGERWPRIRGGKHATRMVVTETDGNAFVQAESGAYPGYRATRSVEFMPRQRRFTVSDRIEPTEPRAAVQFRSLWHVPAKRDVYRRGPDILVRSRKNSLAMMISNVGAPCDAVGIFRPHLEHYANAVVSWKANTLEPAKIIAFSTKASSFDCRLRFDVLDVDDLSGWERL